MNNRELTLFEGREIMLLFPDDVNFKFIGDFLISAKDAALVLEYSSTDKFTNIIREKYLYRVKNNDISDSPKREIRRLNNAGEMFISSFGLNQGIANSTMPKAIPFQDWLYEDMLPSVQKYGAYLTPAKIEEVLADPDTIINLAMQLKNARARIEEQRPLVNFAEICMQSDKSIKVRDLAHSLTSHGIKIGQNKLFEKLRDWKLICQGSTEPTQRAVEQGLLEVVTGVKQKPSGEPFTWRTPYATVKGQIYVADRLKREATGI
ncbi:phage antirepressor KilAC domain-containing protein [Paenibacillus alvei]|uniref:Phage antirepressor KilAC domain-containing protein n=1 Tax=Paenibacillus alvei TaxID=44250 RepID=A0ABT4H748_PAEAL|nr:phage antirepressor KilAC domain-containing protein [Paenibacillus alvei]MCY9764805.1 phage antirepressor KilAC domain-containing protein [Paenibacillus alvei]MCY9770712.1 phage antirepressor KilAC domain-containing protein [Paenibacillus alvei]